MREHVGGSHGVPAGRAGQCSRVRQGACRHGSRPRAGSRPRGFPVGERGIGWPPVGRARPPIHPQAHAHHRDRTDADGPLRVPGLRAAPGLRPAAPRLARSPRARRERGALRPARGPSPRRRPARAPSRRRPRRPSGRARRSSDAGSGPAPGPGRRPGRAGVRRTGSPRGPARGVGSSSSADAVGGHRASASLRRLSVSRRAGPPRGGRAAVSVPGSTMEDRSLG